MLTMLKQEKIKDFEEYLELSRKYNELVEEMKKLELIKDTKISMFDKIFNKEKVKEVKDATDKWNKLHDDAHEVYEKKQKYPFYDGYSIERLENPTTLLQLGFSSLEEAIRYLEERGIKPVFELGDEKLLGKIEKTGGHVLVHLTDYMPKNNKILRMVDKGAKHTVEKSYGTLEVEPFRETTHLCVDGAVQKIVGVSEWGERKYAVIIPMDEVIDNKNVTSTKSVDFTIKGSVEITDKCYILCPEGEEEIVRANNPNAQVVAYHGKDVWDFANSFIQAIGYEYIPNGDLSFVNKEKQQHYEEYASKVFPDVSSAAHTNTIEKVEESLWQGVNTLKGLINGVINGNIKFDSNNQDLRNEVSGALGLIVENFNSIFNSERLDKAKQEFIKIFNLNSIDEVMHITNSEMFKAHYGNLFMQQLERISKFENTEEKQETIVGTRSI